MHLNDEYESIRGQILLLDPLPNVNKAYSMIQRVEKQRQVTGGVGVIREITANVTKSDGVGIGDSEQSPTAFLTRNTGKGRKDGRDNKAARYYNHCKKLGHNTDQYFKLVGYPESKGKYQGESTSESCS